MDCKHGVAVLLAYQQEGPVFESEALHGDIDDLLAGRTRAELVELIHQLADRHPALAHDLTQQRMLEAGDIEGMVEGLRSAITEMAQPPVWEADWMEDDYLIPDYTEVYLGLEQLLSAGYPEAVLDLGRDLLECGNLQVAMYEDEGQTETELAHCIRLLADALRQSSLSSSEKLSWAVECILADEFDLCDNLWLFLEMGHSKSAWGALADQLLTELKSMPTPGDPKDFEAAFSRDGLTDWIIRALERSERNDEIIPLCEAEAPITESYQRLVERLIESGRLSDALTWIGSGIQAVKETSPGTACRLRKYLEEIHQRLENGPALAALRAEEFVRSPTSSTYQACQTAAGELDCWSEVRTDLLDYLQTGELPWEQPGWPLPHSGLAPPPAASPDQFPVIGLLIELAIIEDRPAEVIRWYDQLPKKSYLDPSQANRIASAVDEAAPDRAIEIWESEVGSYSRAG